MPSVGGSAFMRGAAQTPRESSWQCELERSMELKSHLFIPVNKNPLKSLLVIRLWRKSEPSQTHKGTPLDLRSANRVLRAFPDACAPR